MEQLFGDCVWGSYIRISADTDDELCKCCYIFTLTLGPIFQLKQALYLYVTPLILVRMIVSKLSSYL